MTADCRADMMRQLNELSFVLDDLRLFLDTHPDCEAALGYYNRQAARREDALADYTRMFGAIRYYEFTDRNEWQWVEDPWPWEGVY